VAKLPETRSYPRPVFDEFTLSTKEKREMIHQLHLVLDKHCNYGPLQIHRKASVARLINSNVVFLKLIQVRKMTAVDSALFPGTPVLVKLIERSKRTGEGIFYNTVNVGELMAIGDKGFFCLECYSAEIQAEIERTGGVDHFLTRMGYEKTEKEITVSLRSFFDIVVQKKFTSMAVPQTNNPMKSTYNASTGLLYWISECFEGESFCLFVLMWFLFDGAFAMGHLHSGNHITLQMTRYGYLSSPSAVGGYYIILGCCYSILTNIIKAPSL